MLSLFLESLKSVLKAKWFYWVKVAPVFIIPTIFVMRSIDKGEKVINYVYSNEKRDSIILKELSTIKTIQIQQRDSLNIIQKHLRYIDFKFESKLEKINNVTQKHIEGELKYFRQNETQFNLLMEQYRLMNNTENVKKNLNYPIQLVENK